MIEINLQPQTKTLDITNVGGFNLSLINVKMLVLGLILVYVPEPIMESQYTDQFATIDSTLSQINSEQRKLKKKLRALSNLKKEVDELELLEKQLQEKIQVVNKIVNLRVNPFKILNYIAQNTPKDVWLTKLVLNREQVELYGRTLSLKGTSDFIQNLKSGIYFDGSIDYSDYEEPKREGEKAEEKFKGVNFKTFKLVARITSFK